MNGIFILLNSAGLAPLNEQQPAALLHLADAPLLAHLLRQAGESLQKGLVLVPPADLGAVRSWLEAQQGEFSLELIPFDPAADSLTEIWQSGRLAQDEPLFVTTDRAITIPDWEAAAGVNSDIVAFGPASLWLRHSELLSRFAAPGHSGGFENLVDLAPAGLAVPLKAPVYLPLTNVTELLRANQRLLGIGYSSPGALERSYTEEFAIIPPVFIDPTAEITASVIGPYAAVAAGAVIEDSIVRRAVIGPDATINDALLQNSYVGRGADITGRAETIIVPDHSRLKIQNKVDQKQD